MKTCSCCRATSRNMKKGLWSPDEDDKLKKFVTKHGIMKWSQVPLLAGLERCGKSCRLRWLNYLRPGIKRGEFTPLEQKLVFQLQSLHGNRWSWIAQWIPGRTDNEIKNFWNVVHKPRNSSRKSTNMSYVSSYKSRKATDLGHVSSYRLAFPFRIGTCDSNLEAEAKSEEPLHMDSEMSTIFKSSFSPFIDSDMNSTWGLISESFYGAKDQEFMDWNHLLEPDSNSLP